MTQQQPAAENDVFFASLPEVRVCMRHFKHPNAATQPPAIHGSAQLPGVGFLVVNLNGLEVRRAVEAAHCKQLTIDDRQANLKYK